MAKTRRNFYIDDDLYQEFRTYTRIANVSVTEVVEEAIINFNQVMRQIVSGMSAGELIDYSHYKLYKITKEVDDLPNGKDTRIGKSKIHF